MEGILLSNKLQYFYWQCTVKYVFPAICSAIAHSSCCFLRKNLARINHWTYRPLIFTKIIWYGFTCGGDVYIYTYIYMIMLKHALCTVSYLTLIGGAYLYATIGIPKIWHAFFFISSCHTKHLWYRGGNSVSFLNAKCNFYVVSINVYFQLARYWSGIWLSLHK